MFTEITKINPNKISISKIKKAAKIIRDGGLVAFPTETVYGLGADSMNIQAVTKIFKVKKRPFEDPLIVHISNKEDLFKLTKNIPNITLKLIDKFWPGPLTLVLKKSNNVLNIVSGNLNTVAIRMPANSIALTLISESQTPIAAPSANLFSRPSPTSAKHVIDDLNGKIDLIIDGGKTNIGVESTILDLTQNPVCILRPGGISKEKLKKIIPNLKIYNQHKILSAGTYPYHYAPKAKLILVEGNNKIEKIKKLIIRFKNYRIGILTKKENKNKFNVESIKFLGPKNDLNVCATNLFLTLREFDKEGVDIIIAEGVSKKNIGLAIMDRLKKASFNTSKEE